MPQADLLERIAYTHPIDRLCVGHGYGNRHAYATLDPKTDLVDEPGTNRRGIREASNQRFYLLRWEVEVLDAEGRSFVPKRTTLAPAYQETEYTGVGRVLTKRFFVPFECGSSRSAHFHLRAPVGQTVLRIRCRVTFPAGTTATRTVHNGVPYVALRYDDDTEAALWGSFGLVALHLESGDDEAVRVEATFDWPSGDEAAVSFAYALRNATAPPRAAAGPLGQLFDVHSPDAASPASHLFRVGLLGRQTQGAFARYLATARLWTPDPVVNRGYHWAKVNQLRDQQDYRWGTGFSNNPPSDIVVGRDSVWYLLGSSYYARSFSRHLFDLWFEHGVEPSGKFTEYIAAAREPLFRDDYGLNINDNTPLFLLAVHQHYALTGDHAFLDAVYPAVLESADHIVRQRDVGEHNVHRLVWCTSAESFVRGLCGWRNAIRDYRLSGAVTEVNVECAAALRAAAALARHRGDTANADRFDEEAEDLGESIERHLRADAPGNRWYSLNITTDGRRIDQVTGDLVYPALFGPAGTGIAREILGELFGPRFWAAGAEGAGGIRTVSAAEPEYHPAADRATYGLLGGVWPNLALWAAKAAADHGLPDLALRALRGTCLLSERDDPARYNVVPGEFPEYFNGDDLVQRGMHRSTFIPGILIWALLEGIVGLSPRPDGLRVQPSLPVDWPWLAVSNVPYRGYPLSLLADAATRTLYTTLPVESDWSRVVVPAALQRRYHFRGGPEPFWLMVPRDDSVDVLVAADADADTAGVLVDAADRTVAELQVGAGQFVRVALPADSLDGGLSGRRSAGTET